MDAVRLRPAVPADEHFLRQVYASTREEELALVDWSPEQKDAFVRMQFDAQDKHYHEVFPGAQFSVIEHGGKPAGRLYVARWPREIRIVDIALIPAERNAGIGTVLLRKILEEAAADGKTVSIHVEQFNRAVRFYERLGFRRIAERGAHFLMEWRAGEQIQDS